MTIPRQWCGAMDRTYAAFLKGTKNAGVMCRFTLVDGRVIDGPCKLVVVKGGESIIAQVRPNKVPQQGFGLL